jgi:hypothetical protein
MPTTLAPYNTIAEAWSCALLIVPEIFTLKNGHFFFFLDSAIFKHY